MPNQNDPDTLVLKQGASAFQAVLDAAQPLSKALFHIVREQIGSNTAEQQAALKAQLDATAKRIPDQYVAAAFRGELREQFRDHLFASSRYATRKRGGKTAPVGGVKRTTATADATQAEYGRFLVAILLGHPDLLRDTEEAFTALNLPPVLSRLRDAILHACERDVLDSAALLSHLNASGAMKEVAQALSSAPDPLPACAHADAMPAEAEAGWWHFFGLMHRSRLDEEIAAASRAFTEHLDEAAQRAAQRRLIALCNAREALLVPNEGTEAEP